MTEVYIVQQVLRGKNEYIEGVYSKSKDALAYQQELQRRGWVTYCVVRYEVEDN